MIRLKIKEKYVTLHARNTSYTMANYDIRPLQLHILNILLAVDKVCCEHDLRYYLWAGTMLGAVRHRGFIPWDDDMDICMPRPDYDRLMAHAHEWLPAPYEAICADNTPTYPGGFGKVIDASTTLIEREHSDYLGGVYIDVFPLDGVPSSKLAQRFNCIRYAILDKLIYYIHRDPYKHGHGLDSIIIRTMQTLFHHKTLQDAIRRIRVKYDYDSSSKVLDYDDGLSGITEKSVLGNPTPIEFEGCQLMGVEKWNDYLSKKYGDYMTIPQHNEQRQHNFFYLDYHLPYREYHDTRKFVKHHE